MEFKVGDRVELLEPAEGVGEEYANEIGVGTIKAIGCDGSIKVELDGNFHSWWYKREQLRHVSKPTPTPSITVGTQVRLTGVVTGPTRKIDGAIGVQVDAAPGEYRVVYVLESDLEVIRQPFKRGEVVYDRNCPRNDYPAIVINDEEEGKVLLGGLKEGDRNQAYLADGFERRP